MAASLRKWNPAFAACSPHQMFHTSVCPRVSCWSVAVSIVSYRIHLCDNDSLMETFFCSYPSFQSWPLAPNSLLAVRVGGPTGSTSVRAAASPHEERTCQDYIRLNQAKFGYMSTIILAPKTSPGPDTNDLSHLVCKCSSANGLATLPPTAIMSI